jgi:YggT family protein
MPESNFFRFLLFFINMFFQALTLAIIGRALLSWFPMGPRNPFYPLAVILHQVTEPILAPLRRVIPTIGMIDISPIVALLLLNLMQGLLSAALAPYARGGG